ncbi:MAG: FHA domain-containing protein [Polyangiaceae bacterium]
MRFPLRLGETILGRSPYCSVVIPDSEVSRTHAVVRLTREGPEIQDLNSANGTRVNNAQIDEPHLLSEGDRIGIGSAELEVVRAAPDAYQETRQKPLERTATSMDELPDAAEPATEQPTAQRSVTLSPAKPPKDPA